MERGFQTSADDTGVRKVGGHMDNEGMKRAGMRRGGGKTMLALMAAGASPYASCVADFSQPATRGLACYLAVLSLCLVDT